jgi:hypothetical protein
MSDLTPRPVPLEQTRQRIVEQLCEQYAAENLTDELLEERLARAYAATSLPALRELVADLPTTTAAAGPGGRAQSTPGVALARPDLVSEKEVVLAVMAGAERKGSWTPPRHLTVVAVMGGVQLDYRDALFAEGVSEVQIFAMMGGVEIIVPPQVRVEVSGAGFMGGFGHGTVGDVVVDPDAPVLRIRGLAIMGGVDLQTRYSGESQWDARSRERNRRREQKRLNRGR